MKSPQIMAWFQEYKTKPPLLSINIFRPQIFYRGKPSQLERNINIILNLRPAKGTKVSSSSLVGFFPQIFVLKRQIIQYNL